MTKIKTVFIVVGLVFSLGAFAQSDFIIPKVELDNLVSESNRDRNFLVDKLNITDLADIDGSPYWEEEFKKGTAYDKSKDKSVSVFLRYRIYDDSFEAKRSIDEPDDAAIPLKRSSNLEIRIENKPFKFLKRLPVKGEGENFIDGYALLLQKGVDDEDVSLYKRFKQQYNPAESGETGYQKGRKAQLIDKNYYIIEDGNSLHWVYVSKRKVIDAFPKHKKELKKYISDQKLKFRKSSKDNDLIQLVKYYNSL